jgi:hypothetical protein
MNRQSQLTICYRIYAATPVNVWLLLLLLLQVKRVIRKVAAVLLHETGMRQAAQIELAVAHWNLVSRQQQQQQLWAQYKQP